VRGFGGAFCPVEQFVGKLWADEKIFQKEADVRGNPPLDTPVALGKLATASRKDASTQAILTQVPGALQKNKSPLLSTNSSPTA
jgi:hypothetical protein